MRNLNGLPGVDFLDRAVSKFALPDYHWGPSVYHMKPPASSTSMAMPHILEVLKIVEGAVNLDRNKVEAYGQLLAKKLADEGHSELSKAMLNLLANSKSKQLFPNTLTAEKRIPVDQESKLQLGDERTYNNHSINVVLSNETESLISEFLAHIEASGKLMEHGLGISPSMILYGPPGCGKTEIAKYVGARLGLPVIVARSDSLISSYLGSTAKNIRSLFEYAMSHPCVLFLDEFDALAKLRDDRHELGELKRVVISLLQNIDALDGRTIILAATNHEHLLDPAIWRRFSYRVKIKLPDITMRRKLIPIFLGYEPELLDEIVLMSEGFSGSDIKDALLATKRNALINNEDRPSNQDLMWKFIKKAYQDTNWEALSPPQQVYALKQKNRELFSNSIIGNLLDVSRGYVPKLYKKGEQMSIEFLRTSTDGQ